MDVMTPSFDLQGHRGARGLFPENTLEGIAATIALGVRTIELDVAVTADDVAVIFHDVALNADIVREPSGAWITPPGTLLRALTQADLARYDVGRLRPGSPTARRHPAQQPIDGAHIPTLAQILALTVPAGVLVAAELKTLPAQPDATVTPEAMARRVIALAEAADGLELLDIRAFDWRALDACEAIRPGLKRTWLTSPDTAAEAALWWGRPLAGSVPRTLAAAGGTTWAPEYVDLTEAAIAEAHALGLRVIPWTVNDAADIARLIGWGVDGICTDRPDIALAVMREPITPPG
jgi:glycerophosphoryl diester phosphodiesterase